MAGGMAKTMAVAVLLLRLPCDDRLFLLCSLTASLPFEPNGVGIASPLLSRLLLQLPSPDFLMVFLMFGQEFHCQTALVALNTQRWMWMGSILFLVLEVLVNARANAQPIQLPALCLSSGLVLVMKTSARYRSSSSQPSNGVTGSRASVRDYCMIKRIVYRTQARPCT